jgi:hypothetical protein
MDNRDWPLARYRRSLGTHVTYPTLPPSHPSIYIRASIIDSILKMIFGLWGVLS